MHLDQIRKTLKEKLGENTHNQEVCEDCEEIVEEDLEPATEIDNELFFFSSVLDKTYLESDDVNLEALVQVLGACINSISRYGHKKGCLTCVKQFVQGEKGDLDGSAYKEHLQRGGL